MRNRKIDKISSKINNILEVPRELTDNNPKITIIGFDEMLIENYKGILEYSEDLIRLSNNICIYGQELSVEEISSEDILIIGKIKNIEFE